MTEPTPNAGQRELIENTDGIYLVDAGAGTGRHSPSPGGTPKSSTSPTSSPTTSSW
jgi:hypothetical protein